MFNDMYLKFPDEAAAKAVLYRKQRPAGFVFDHAEVDVWVYQTAYGEHAFHMEYTPEECEEYGYTFLRKDKETVPVDSNPDVGEWEYQPKFRNIDTIGVITKQVDEEATETLPGWHVNVRLVEEEDAEALTPYQVFPSTPSRVWA